jgi:hypothetical protein
MNAALSLCAYRMDCALKARDGSAWVHWKHRVKWLRENVRRYGKHAESESVEMLRIDLGESARPRDGVVHPRLASYRARRVETAQELLHTFHA